MLNGLPEKSYLTAYAPSYNPETEAKCMDAWAMKVDVNSNTNRHLIPGFQPYYIKEEEPVPTLLFSGHFFFAPGRVITEIPYDPKLYFHGEEITMAARLYTNGWNGYHPHIPVIWHEYTRSGRVKVWDDDPKWWEKDQQAREQVRQTFVTGMGEERSVSEFLNKIYK